MSHLRQPAEALCFIELISRRGCAIQEDDADQELLLDGPVPPVGAGHGGGLIELPLSYNLTGHTGSFMYMAPEVFNVGGWYNNNDNSTIRLQQTLTSAHQVATDADLSRLTT